MWSGFTPENISKALSITKKKDEIQGLIDRHFYSEYSQDELNDGLYRGMLEGLNDDYADYFSQKEYEDFTIQAFGKYAGIGAALIKDTNTGSVSVTKVYEDSPAYNAGIKEGDIFISADEYMAADLDLNDFVSHIRGPEGTDVKIVYERNGEQNEVTITRRIVITPSVFYHMLDENTGYLQITDFQENTETEFKNAVNALLEEGMTDIVYDLRSNPGGLVNSVTKILDDMLPEGTVVYTMDKNGNRTDYNSDEENQMNYPCIVLVNGNTASASEIFSGAVRDFKYGTILGTTTYGKGVVQNIYRLSDGSAVKFTIAEYFTPSGENIHKVGIKPDIELEYEYSGPEDKDYNWQYDNQILKAMELLNE